MARAIYQQASSHPEDDFSDWETALWDDEGPTITVE